VRPQRDRPRFYTADDVLELLPMRVGPGGPLGRPSSVPSGSSHAGVAPSSATEPRDRSCAPASVVPSHGLASACESETPGCCPSRPRDPLISLVVGRLANPR
jgi:hypothetical protein